MKGSVLDFDFDFEAAVLLVGRVSLVLFSSLDGDVSLPSLAGDVSLVAGVVDVVFDVVVGVVPVVGVVVVFGVGAVWL